jgi:hypothetical protein
MQILRLTKLLGKNDLGHEMEYRSKIRKNSVANFSSTNEKPPEESGGLKYSHEKQKNVIQLKAK